MIAFTAIFVLAITAVILLVRLSHGSWSFTITTRNRSFEFNGPGTVVRKASFREDLETGLVAFLAESIAGMEVGDTTTVSNEDDSKGFCIALEGDDVVLGFGLPKAGSESRARSVMAALGCEEYSASGASGVLEFRLPPEPADAARVSSQFLVEFCVPTPEERFTAIHERNRHYGETE